MPIIVGLPLVAAIFALLALRSTGASRWCAVAGTTVVLILWGWYISALMGMSLPD